DQELCRRNGLRCAELPLLLFVGKDLSFDWGTFRKAFRFVLSERAAGRTVYFHCLHGSDRTGALAAALTLRERTCGRNYDKAALKEEIDSALERHGFHGRYAFLRSAIDGWVAEPASQPWLCE
ncbi:MAG TPA: tyrosine-protein phosphatase, partial [Elusimicrobiales bacterium]|nr:tyrosine-protein phosphatase [Elusimicrobiales bacterium]